MAEHDDPIDPIDSVDSIDAILAQWRHARPDLDLAPLGVFGRIMRLSLLLNTALERAFERYGLRGGDFDVLTTLRRSGPASSLTPSALADSLLMSRAGMTKRLDRLEADGLVARRVDPADRRSFRVALSERGRVLIDAALTHHAATMATLAASLTPEDNAHLAESLRTLLHAVSEFDFAGYPGLD